MLGIDTPEGCTTNNVCNKIYNFVIFGAALTNNQ